MNIQTAIGYIVKQMEDIRYILYQILECNAILQTIVMLKNMKIISCLVSFNLYNIMVHEYMST